MTDKSSDKTDTLMVYRDDDGIVVFDYGTQIIDLKGALISNEMHRKLNPKGPEPILIIGESATGVRSDLVAYAASKEVVDVTAASAILATSAVAQVLANLYMKFHDTPYPTRVFTDEKAARKWLLEVTGE